jgi:Mrp family chromosome partitioning ATPase
MSIDLPAVTGTQEARATLRAERLSRLRATALSTLIQAQPPKGLPKDEPMVVEADLAPPEEVLADMALPALHVSRLDRPGSGDSLPRGLVAIEGNAKDAAPLGLASDPLARPKSSLPRPSEPPAPAKSVVASVREAAACRTTSAAPVARYRLDTAATPGPPPPAAMPAFALTGAPKPNAADKPGPYPVEEIYRELRRNLAAALPAGQACAMAWLSPTGSEDAAPHVIGLALALAESCDGEILLVDANFQSGMLTRHMALGGKPGLVEVLAKKLHAQAAAQETAMARLRILPRGGESSAGLARRVDEGEIQSLLAGLKSRYEFVLIDVPGVEQPHSLPLAKAADATVLVIALDYTPRETVQEALEVLQLHQARVAGCVLTDQPE